MTTTDPPAVPPPVSTSGLPEPARHRRKGLWVLLAVGIVVFVAAAVVTDLPVGSSRASNLANAKSVISEIASDVAPCTHAVNEGVGLYLDVAAGTLTATERAEVPGLAKDDYAACSFTEDGINDLAGIEEPNSSVGDRLNQLASQALSWCSSDGMGTLYYINILVSRPGDTVERTRLETSERELDSERASIEETLTDIAHLLHTTSLPHLDLVKIS